MYLKCDILLLIDMFRNNINKYLEITSNRIMDYVQVIISPCLSWDPMLKMTKNYHEFIPDSGMHTFFEKGTRGVILYSSNRHSKANKK